MLFGNSSQIENIEILEFYCFSKINLRENNEIFFMGNLYIFILSIYVKGKYIIKYIFF